jgi:hypothetical protein
MSDPNTPNQFLKSSSIGNSDTPSFSPGVAASFELTGSDGTGPGGGVISVGATAPITTTGGATPVIGITPATDLLPGSLSAADKTKLDGLSSTPVNGVTGAAPIVSSGGQNPTISITPATDTVAGSLSAVDKTRADTSFVTPKMFGAVGDGVADDGPALAAADASAVALRMPLWISNGTYRAVGALTLSSEVIMAGGAQLAPTGTLTISGSFVAPATVQIWPAATSVLFKGPVYQGGKVAEMWVNWWGAKGDNATDSTLSFISAFASYQTMLQSSPIFSTGSALVPELRLAPGAYTVNADLSTAPIIEIENVVGGIFRGCGTGSTIIQTAISNSAAAVIQRTNCQHFRIVDVSIVPGFSGAHLTGFVAVGSTSIPVVSAAFFVGEPVTLWQFGQWYEEAVVTGIPDGGHITIDHPTRFRFDTNNFVLTCVRACVRDFNDVGDAGYLANSTANTIENCQLGSNAIATCLYGWAAECAGGTGSASDVNNDLHQIVNTVATNPMIGGVFIGHKNSIQSKIVRSAMSQGGLSFWGIHAPNGGGADVLQSGFSGVWARIGLGGTSSGAFKITSCHSESNSAPFFRADQWIPNCTRLTASFVQPAVGSSVTITVASTAAWAATGQTGVVAGGGWYTMTVLNGTQISMLNLGAEENYPPGTTVPNGAQVGQSLKFAIVQCTALDDFAGPARTTITAPAAGGQPVVTVASVAGYWPGQKFTLSDQVGNGVSKLTVQAVDPVALTLTMTTNLSTGYTSLSGGIYGYASPSYYIDISGRSSTIQISTSFMDQGQDQVPGQELHLCDAVSRTSQMSIRDTPLGSVGFTLANAFLYMSMGQLTEAAGPVRAFRETYKGDSASVVEGANQISNSGGHYPAGAMKGITPLFVQIDATMSPYTPALDTIVVVNTGSGSVVISLPPVPIWHSVTVKQDESSALGANTITINADPTQTLAQPVPNNGTFAPSYVITGNQSLGLEIKWSNLGSGGSPIRLLVE